MKNRRLVSGKLSLLCNRIPLLSNAGRDVSQHWMTYRRKLMDHVARIGGLSIGRAAADVYLGLPKSITVPGWTGSDFSDNDYIQDFVSSFSLAHYRILHLNISVLHSIAFISSVAAIILAVSGIFNISVSATGRSIRDDPVSDQIRRTWLTEWWTFQPALTAVDRRTEPDPVHFRRLNAYQHPCHKLRR